MVPRNLFLGLTLLVYASSVLAYDPDPLQDFCVAAAEPNVFVNGIICKDPQLVNSSDFVFKAKMNIKGNTSNPSGSAINEATVKQFPALNTLGISFARVDYAPDGGSIAPHIHPRASELLLLLEGTLLVGFVTSYPDYKLFSEVLEPGDVFVFPKGLVHFQYNVGRTSAFTFSAFGSQNPGITEIAWAVFGPNPRIQPDVLERAFQVNSTVIDQLEGQFGARGTLPMQKKLLMPV